MSRIACARISLSGQSWINVRRRNLRGVGHSRSVGVESNRSTESTPDHSSLGSLSSLSGKPFSSFLQRNRLLILQFHGCSSSVPRAILRERINRRVDQMFEQGVVEEVAAVGAIGPTASKAIGFKPDPFIDRRNYRHVNLQGGYQAADPKLRQSAK